MNNYVKIGILAIIAALAIYLIPQRAQGPTNENGQNNNGGNNNGQQTTVTDFASCVSAGFPVLQSQPRQCIAANGQTYVDPATQNAEVILETPVKDQLVRSPLTVKGKARGNWFFEANIPVTLKDQNGKVLAQKGFQAKGEWMTTNFVDFEDTLTFSTPTTEFGTLTVAKDNPSGLLENDKEYVVQVRFR